MSGAATAGNGAGEQGPRGTSGSGSGRGSWRRGSTQLQIRRRRYKGELVTRVSRDGSGSGGWMVCRQWAIVAGVRIRGVCHLKKFALCAVAQRHDKAKLEARAGWAGSERWRMRGYLAGSSAALQNAQNVSFPRSLLGVWRRPGLAGPTSVPDLASRACEGSPRLVLCLLEWERGCGVVALVRNWGKQAQGPSPFNLKSQWSRIQA